MGAKFECFSKTCAGATVIDLVANEVVACPTCGATYLFDGTETKRVDEKGKPLSDEAIDNWEATGVATTLRELERKAAAVPDEHFNVVARMSAETLTFISNLLFVALGLVVALTVVAFVQAGDSAKARALFLSGLFQTLVVFSVAYLFRAISYLQRGQLRILEKLEERN